MTTAFPSLEPTIISAKPSAPSVERPRLYVEGEILPALYHYAVQVQLPSYFMEVPASAQHEVDAAIQALRANDRFLERAIEVGAVMVFGVNEKGALSEYPVTIRVDLGGCVAIPP